MVYFAAPDLELGLLERTPSPTTPELEPITSANSNSNRLSTNDRYHLHEVIGDTLEVLSRHLRAHSWDARRASLSLWCSDRQAWWVDMRRSGLAVIIFSTFSLSLCQQRFARRALEGNGNGIRWALFRNRWVSRFRNWFDNIFWIP
jgi:hypothetical protein